MTDPVLIGFDLATQVGWCAGAASRDPAVGSFRLPATGNDVGAYLLDAREFYRILLRRFSPLACIYEAPVTMPNQTPEVTTKLHALPGVLEMECKEAGIPVKKVYPVTIKKTVTGHGGSPKPLVFSRVAALGLKPANKDEADAVGAWLCGVQHYSEHWPAWAERLRRAEDGFLD